MPHAPLLDEQLCFAVYAASRAMIQSYGPMLRELELTYPQYLVMMVLWESAPLSVSELGKRLMLDSGTLTPLLKRLEKSSLLIRQRDSQDERKVQIKLSLKGQCLSQKAALLHQRLLCELEPQKEELRLLRDKLRILTKALKQE